MPVPKGRPRCECRGSFPRIYTPKTTVVFERRVAAVAKGGIAFRHQLEGHRLGLEVVAVFPRPGRLQPKKYGDERRWHEGAADLDNVVKAVADGIQLSGLISNDNAIVQISATKVYAARGEQPKTVVTLRPLQGQPDAVGGR